MEIIPSPWQLKGKGYIMIFKFSRDFVLKNSFLPEEWMTWFKGGFGAVMLVDYQESNAGPYRELLFIPGKFSFFGSKHYTISKIYVSTESSVISGRANWAIPKELADFSWQSQAARDSISVSKDGVNIMEISLQAKGPYFPVNTRYLPLSIGQEGMERTLITKPSGKGRGRLGNLEAVSVNKEYFPDISGLKPLIICKVDPFQMTFPVAREIQGDN